MGMVWGLGMSPRDGEDSNWSGVGRDGVQEQDEVVMGRGFITI